jgi:hypothetical protein
MKQRRIKKRLALSTIYLLAQGLVAQGPDDHPVVL